ncbi:MAG: lipid A deacylase LpxR family protein [Planctomycetota bacterium]
MRSLLTSRAGVLAVAAGVLAASSVAEERPAEQPTKRPVQFDLLIENDSTFNLDREDRHYSSGQALAIGFPSVELADWLTERTPIAADRAAFGFVGAYLLYTPDNIDRDRPSPGQHPYAGVAYVGGYLQRDRRHPRYAGLTEFDHLELDLGIVGPSALGEQVQTAVHDAFGGEEPNGWDVQHPDRPVVQLTYRHKWRFDLLNDGNPIDSFGDPVERGGWGIDMIPQLAASVGTLRVAGEGSGVVRFGFNLPDDFGPGFVDDLPSATAPRRLPRGGAFSAYGYLGGGGRLVGWDTVLDGPFYGDNDFDDESSTFVAFGRVGGAVGYRWEGWSVEAGYGVTFHTDTIVGQQGEQHYASITLAVTGRF